MRVEKTAARDDKTAAVQDETRSDQAKSDRRHSHNLKVLHLWVAKIKLQQVSEANAIQDWHICKSVGSRKSAHTTRGVGKAYGRGKLWQGKAVCPLKSLVQKLCALSGT